MSLSRFAGYQHATAPQLKNQIAYTAGFGVIAAITRAATFNNAESESVPIESLAIWKFS